MHTLAPTLNGPQEFGVNDTEQMLTAIVENDKLTFEHLTYVTKLADEVIARGEHLPANHPLRQPAFVDNYHAARASYIERQNELKNSQAIKAKSWIGERITALRIWADLRAKGLGALPLVPVAVGAVAGIVASVAIYYAFRPRYSESERDLKISKDLRNLLSQVEPEVANQITEDLERQIDKAYNAGKRAGTFGGLLKLGQYGLIAGTGIALFVWGFPKLTKAIDKTKDRLQEA